MTQHISSIARACYFHLRRIRQVKRCLNETCLRILIQALVIYRLDYCNSVLSGLPSSTLQPLSSVLHTAARLIKDLGPRDNITPTLKQLHWLPIRARIAFKTCLLMYHIHSGTPPSYMASMVSWSRHVQFSTLEDSDRQREGISPYSAQTGSLETVLSLSRDLQNGTEFQLH